MGIYSKVQQYISGYYCKIIRMFVFLCIMLADQLQSLLQLQHCSKFVFAVTAAETSTGQIADFSVAVVELDFKGICPCTIA